MSKLPKDTPKEVQDLLKIGRSLSAASMPSLDKKTKKAMAREIGFASKPVWQEHPVVFAVTSAFIITGLTLTGFAQKASPGTPLYNIKKGTDNVRVLVQPGFKAQLEQEQQMESATQKKSSGSSTPAQSDDRRSGSDSGSSGSRQSGTNDDTSDSQSHTTSSGSNSGSDDKKQSQSTNSGSGNSNPPKTENDSHHGSDQ